MLRTYLKFFGTSLRAKSIRGALY